MSADPAHPAGAVDAASARTEQAGPRLRQGRASNHRIGAVVAGAWLGLASAVTPVSAVAAGAEGVEPSAQGTPSDDPALAELVVPRTGDALFAGTHECILGPHRTVDLTSAVPGQLESVLVERSDEVRAGQAIAHLEAGVERAALALAEALAEVNSEVRIEEVTRALDRRRMQRMGALYARNAVALDDKEQADSEAALAGLRLQQAKEKRRIRALDKFKARAVLERRTVRSPIDGLIVERFRNEGEFVENQPIVRIAQLDPLQVETVLPMALFGEVRRGMRANIRLKHDGAAEHVATVRLVDRMGDAASDTFGVRLTLPNPDHRLPAGTRCQVSFMADDTAPADASDAPADLPNPVDSSEQDGPDALNASPSDRSEAGPNDTFPEPTEHDPTPALEPEWPVEPDPPTNAPILRESSLGSSAEPARAVCSRVPVQGGAPEAESLMRELDGQGLSARVGHEVETEVFGYLVASMKQTDSAELRTLSRQLRAAGVTDQAPLARGPYAPRVSMGAYPDRSSAERRLAAIRERDIEAELLPRTRYRKVWWVELDASTEQVLAVASEAEGALANLRPVACESEPASSSAGLQAGLEPGDASLPGVGHR